MQNQRGRQPVVNTDSLPSRNLSEIWPDRRPQQCTTCPPGEVVIEQYKPTSLTAPIIYDGTAQVKMLNASLPPLYGPAARADHVPVHELLEAAGASLGRHLVQQHVPIIRKNYNVGFYWPIMVVEGCPEKTTHRDARSEVKLCCLLGGGHSPGDLVFIARWCVARSSSTWSVPSTISAGRIILVPPTISRG